MKPLGSLNFVQSLFSLVLHILKRLAEVKKIIISHYSYSIRYLKDSRRFGSQGGALCSDYPSAASGPRRVEHCSAFDYIVYFVLPLSAFGLAAVHSAYPSVLDTHILSLGTCMGQATRGSSGSISFVLAVFFGGTAALFLPGLLHYGPTSTGKCRTSTCAPGAHESKNSFEEPRVWGHVAASPHSSYCNQSASSASFTQCFGGTSTPTPTWTSGQHAYSKGQAMVLYVQSVCSEWLQLLQHLRKCSECRDATSVPGSRQSPSTMGLSNRSMVGHGGRSASASQAAALPPPTFTQGQTGARRQKWWQRLWQGPQCQRRASCRRLQFYGFNSCSGSTCRTTAQGSSSETGAGAFTVGSTRRVGGQPRPQVTGSYAAALCGQGKRSSRCSPRDDGHLHVYQYAHGDEGAAPAGCYESGGEECPRSNPQGASDVRGSMAGLYRQALQSAPAATAGTRNLPRQAQRGRRAVAYQGIHGLERNCQSCSRGAAHRRGGGTRRCHGRRSHGRGGRGSKVEPRAHQAVQLAGSTSACLCQLPDSGSDARARTHTTRETGSTHSSGDSPVVPGDVARQAHGSGNRRSWGRCHYALCAAAAFLQSGSRSAPCLGLGTSLQSGLHGPCTWNGLYGDHSVCQDEVYISPWLAIFRAMRLELEVSTADLQHVDHAAQFAWLCDDHGQPPSGSDADSDFVKLLQAQVHIVQPGKPRHGCRDLLPVEGRACSGLSPRTQMDNSGAEGKLPLHVRTSWMSPGTPAHPADRLRGEANSSVQYSSGQCTASCTKVTAFVDPVHTAPDGAGLSFGVRRCSPKKVYFGHTVDFWFPSEDQILLPNRTSADNVRHSLIRSSLKGRASAQGYPAQAHRPPGCTGNLSRTLPQLCCNPQVTDTEDTAPVWTDVTAAVLEGCIPRTSGVSACIPPLPLSCAPDRPQAKRVFRPLARMGTAPFVPSTEPTASVPAVALTPGLQPIPHHGLPQPFARPGRFTSFDAMDQARSFSRNPDWDVQRCLFEAVSSAAIPNPIGRRLHYPVYGFDEPQFVVHRNDRRFTHKSVVFVCPSAVPHYWVCDVPNGLSPQTFLLEMVMDSLHPWHRTFASWPTFTCLVNGAPVDCFRTLPARTDVVDILLGPHFDYSDLVAAVTAETRNRPPTPPIPAQRWERRRLREPPSSPIPVEDTFLQPSTSSATVADDAEGPDTFVVFDVYFHARVLPCRRHHSMAHRAAIALEHTPQISAEVAGFREVRFRLPGFPSSQLVLWGDKLPDSVILPVALGTEPSTVCTVESPQAFSALQLVTLMCRHCQLPDHVIEAVAELDARLVVNEEPVYPLDPGTCARADTAMLQGVLFRPTLHLATPSPLSPSALSRDGSDPAMDFIQTLSSAERGTAEFAVFAEGCGPCVLPIPGGASMADLVDLAFSEFPAYGPRCGHRLLSRSLPGFPPIQFCIWGTLGIDERVVLVVPPNQNEVRTVRALRSCSPVRLLQMAGCDELSDEVGARRSHVIADGRPYQPTDTFVVQAHAVFRIARGPPPARIQSTFLRRWAQPPPQSLPCVPTCQITDAEADGTICVHRVGDCPVTLPVPCTLRAIQASSFAVAVLGGNPQALLRFPLASPLGKHYLAHACRCLLLCGWRAPWLGSQHSQHGLHHHPLWL